METMNEIAIQPKALEQRAAQRAPDRHPDVRLAAACREFEGMLLAIILKNGMKSAWNDEAEPAPGSRNLQDFAMEQTARALGQQGVFGMAETMMAQIARSATNDETGTTDGRFVGQNGAVRERFLRTGDREI
jgi:Rod binding domain-containing protein